MPATSTYRRRKEAGLCVFCGDYPPEPGRTGCAPCLADRRAYRRAYDGCKPWRPGGPGRPPASSDQAPAAEAGPMPRSRILERMREQLGRAHA